MYISFQITVVLIAQVLDAQHVVQLVGLDKELTMCNTMNFIQHFLDKTQKKPLGKGTNPIDNVYQSMFLMLYIFILIIWDDNF